ncbi:MAG: M3 family oligoendopeptidase [Rhodobacterales bacterium]|nr:M3 family oligoendopeptidase [Paracoccaceae bacterium]NCV48259.1 M3 family oligoendopeptidase [Rhodobacterales bacterium]|tara:strand:+ start:864 stop:2681 length:1818 start_codon:yes stop_codon:yes gene_type:complete
MFQLPIRTLDSEHSTGSSELGQLPDWNLNDLYTATDAKELIRDLNWLEKECNEFAKSYEGKLHTLSDKEMLNCIVRNEKISSISGRIISYAGLLYYQKTTDADRAKFLSDMQEKITVFTTKLVFFSLEINSLEDEFLDKLFTKNDQLARYKPVFEKIRAMKPYQLNDEIEKFLHDLGIVGDAWEKLFDETIAGLTFKIGDESLNIEATLNLLTDQNRENREKATRELARVFSENIKVFTRVHNTQAKEKEIIDRWRGMPTAQMGRHLANQVEPEVVEALRNAVVKAYPEISHRYYELKRKWLGLEIMQVWDRNAPLPMESNKLVTWDEAQKVVTGAYTNFDSRMSDLITPFFNEGWIDAGVKPGKAPGAFAHPTVTDVHPYIMLNYLGKPRDVMTLAHELGHGVHQVLASSQGQMLSSTPLTLAETASVFGEMLTFQQMLDQSCDKNERKVLLANKVEDMINTVVRQIAFYDFECKLHNARRSGELTPSDINSLWMSVQSESLGPAFEFVDGYETFWSYIPHFVHSPFYVYAYAFGDGLVNALYATYKENPKGFEDKYFNLLSAGGSKHHKELLKPFDLDASDPKFWTKGLSMISGMIDELETFE